MTLADLLDTLGIGRPAWHAFAACRGMGTETFFPERGEPVAPARRICASCPVTDQCLAAGLNEREGVWGNTTERQRRRIKRDRLMGTPGSRRNDLGEEACAHGHPWATDRYLSVDGRWRCRGCNAANQRRSRQRRGAA